MINAWNNFWASIAMLFEAFFNASSALNHGAEYANKSAEAMKLEAQIEQAATLRDLKDKLGITD